MAKARCDVTKSIVDSLEKKTNFEFEHSNAFHRALKDMKMIVEEDLDEINLLNHHFFVTNGDELLVTLFVTRQCNFRCSYCYENHENKRMSSELYENLTEAIKIEVKSKGYKRVLISFFGGEPMLEYQAICGFMKNMFMFSRTENIPIFGQMTTNAYLLSLEKFQKLVELNVLYYQITLDGLKETHDNNRFLADGMGTWDRIIQNLKAVKNSNLQFEISLRTNFDLDNMANIKDYFSFLSKYFSEDRRFNAQFEEIKKLSTEINGQLNENNADTKILSELFTLASESKLNVSNFNIEPFGYMCYASKNNSLVIDTDGTLMKCTVVIDSYKNVIGKLKNGKFDIEDTKICNWTSYNLPKYCYECKILALCFGRKCPISIINSSISDLTHCSNNVLSYEAYMRYIYHLS